MNSSTRIKLYHIAPHNLLASFRQTALNPSLLIFHHLQGIPEDAVVENVYANQEFRAIIFVVSHPSFPEVEPHIIPERETGTITIEPAFRASALVAILNEWETYLFGPDNTSRSDLSDYERGIFDACKSFALRVPEPLRKGPFTDITAQV